MADPRSPYIQWIAEHVELDPHGQCKEVTERMASAFPELRRVRGHYVCPVVGPQPHWWMVTPDGTVVDPTRTQFPSQGQGAYEPHEGPPVADGWETRERPLLRAKPGSSSKPAAHFHSNSTCVDSR
jgi:hypothetical protein